MNTNKQIHIVIGNDPQDGATENTFDPKAFASVPALLDEGTTYIVATDSNDTVHRVASSTEHDRQIVGALTGSWVAQGYRVRTVTSLQELVKLLRKSIKVGKEGEGEGAAQAQTPAPAAAASADPAPAGKDGGDPPPHAGHLNGAGAANDNHPVFQ